MNNVTTDKYWDCECEKDFIHPKEIGSCPDCGSLKDEQPDSHVKEVLELGFNVPDNMKKSALFTIKSLGLEWLKKNVSPTEWKKDLWDGLDDNLTIHVFIDKDMAYKAMVFRRNLGEHFDFDHPIEIV